MAKKRAKAKKSLWDKVHDIDASFAEGINTATNEELREQIVNIDNNDEQIMEAKEADPDLPVFREQLKTANETYSIPMKNNKMKRKLVIDMLKSRGQLI